MDAHNLHQLGLASRIHTSPHSTHTAHSQQVQHSHTSQKYMHQSLGKSYIVSFPVQSPLARIQLNKTVCLAETPHPIGPNQSSTRTDAQQVSYWVCEQTSALRCHPLHRSPVAAVALVPSPTQFLPSVSQVKERVTADPRFRQLPPLAAVQGPTLRPLHSRSGHVATEPQSAMTGSRYQNPCCMPRFASGKPSTAAAARPVESVHLPVRQAPAPRLRHPFAARRCDHSGQCGWRHALPRQPTRHVPYTPPTQTACLHSSTDILSCLCTVLTVRAPIQNYIVTGTFTRNDRDTQNADARVRIKCDVV